MSDRSYVKPKPTVTWALLYDTPKETFIGGSHPSRDKVLGMARTSSAAVKIVKIEIDPETHEVTSCETQDIQP